MSTVTSQMNLVVPSVGDSDYPGSISTSMTLIDAHDHTTTKGVQIPTAGIANAAITKPKLAALGQQVSLGSGSFGTTNTSYVDVPNLSISITTTGRPVFVAVISDASGVEASMSALIDPAGSGGKVRFLRGATDVGSYEFAIQNGVANSVALYVLPMPLFAIDVPAAGTYTYKFQILSTTGIFVNSAIINFYKLVAYEL